MGKFSINTNFACRETAERDAQKYIRGIITEIEGVIENVDDPPQEITEFLDRLRNVDLRIEGERGV